MRIQLPPGRKWLKIDMSESVDILVIPDDAVVLEHNQKPSDSDVRLAKMINAAQDVIVQLEDIIKALKSTGV